MENWFIDNLHMHQEHSGMLPVIGSEMVMRFDLQTGEQISSSPKSLRFEGSNSSSVQVRCNGNRVSVVGNPSRWNRSENLFGFKTFDECVQVYNQILLSVGLPPFTKCTSYQFTQVEEGAKHQVVTDGAFIDHVDFTRNFSVGRGNEKSFLKAMASISWGKTRNSKPYLYPNEQTVDCHKGSTLRYQKVYEKAANLLDDRKKNLKTATDSEVHYYEKLIGWCQEHGILREEHSFKNTWLRRKNYRFYGITKEIDFKPHLEEIQNAMKKLEVSNTQYESISDQLLAENVVKARQAANATQMVYLQWLHGLSLDVKERQLRTHKSRLLQLGIDVSIPHDMSRTPLRIKSNDLIDVKNIVPPSWYKHPSTQPRLALVS